MREKWGLFGSFCGLTYVLSTYPLRNNGSSDKQVSLGHMLPLNHILKDTQKGTLFTEFIDMKINKFPENAHHALQYIMFFCLTQDSAKYQLYDGSQ